MTDCGLLRLRRQHLPRWLHAAFRSAFRTVTHMPRTAATVGSASRSQSFVSTLTPPHLLTTVGQLSTCCICNATCTCIFECRPAFRSHPLHCIRSDKRPSFAYRVLVMFVCVAPSNNPHSVHRAPRPTASNNKRWREHIANHFPDRKARNYAVVHSHRLELAMLHRPQRACVANKNKNTLLKTVPETNLISTIRPYP
jgi:hypothetical protein